MAQAVSTSEVPCRYFQQGRCRNGEGCAYSHEPAAGRTELARPNRDEPIIAPPALDFRASITCQFYARGRCTNEGKCPYSHPEEPTDAPGRQADTSAAQDLKQDQESFMRAIGGAVVQFGDGGSVCRLSLIWEASIVRIGGIPPSTTAESLRELLQTPECPIAMDSIQLNTTTACAYVSCEDPESADTLCQQLAVQFALDPAHCDLTLQSLMPRNTSSTTTQRLSCKKVTVSWYRATRLVWLNFGRQQIAQRVCDKFNSGKYTIGDRRIQAVLPKQTGGTPRNPVAWTVLLQDVSAGAGKDEIDASIWSTAEKPRHIELDPSAASSDMDLIPTHVESLLTQFGPVDFTLDPRDHGKRVKAIALFVDENDARQAVKALHNQQQEFLGRGKLFLQHMNSSKFKISAKVYNCVKNDLEALAMGWQKAQLAFRTYQDPGPENRFVTIKVEGEQAKEVADATKVVGDIVAGKLIETDGVPFWSPALATNGSALQKLKRIQQELGVFVERNKAKRQLRYFGAPASYSRVQKLLAEEVGVDAVSLHTIILDEKQFTWACRGGLARMSAAFGADVVTLDVVSSLKKITLTGSVPLYQQAMDFIKQAQDCVPDSARTDGSPQDCTICWTPAESPVFLACEHIYCLECLESLCTMAGSSGGEFSISCQGGMGACKKLLPLTELQNLLSSDALETSLETSFASYIRRRPQDFRYCPTPDCGYIYRSSDKARTHTCIKCFEAICTACHERHPTISCAEYKYLASGDQEVFEKYKKMMNMKDCPECKTVMEKTEGCNHMVCGGCKIHLCWICLATFPASELCYEHLSEVHGGCFDVLRV
ncbi:hypothetical protein LTR56_012802 [Elasticomyces elasticus]|nr:hypothetical protein LTR56_012802 [Elasticomyces elasticus]KAK3647155.1 hypothetical protein LTR22_013948 [Elasticomyces elasticus]KAK4918591.1 hypothetical protein LTR49_013661 [Elasticomyces elasticus]KAK5756111.1 hypothetical protein LTS12_013794 [Elasticomyces elasticus]